MITFPAAVQIAQDLERKFEGFFPRPYLCPAGIPSIGFGATFYENGVRVTLLDPPINRERAEALLLWHTENVFLPQVLKLCPGATDVYLLAALIDFTFNLGAGRLKASTLRRLVNSGDWGKLPAEFRKWCRAGGRTLRGLQLRREAEIALPWPKLSTSI